LSRHTLIYTQAIRHKYEMSRHTFSYTQVLCHKYVRCLGTLLAIHRYYATNTRVVLSHFELYTGNLPLQADVGKKLLICVLIAIEL
jgi:hypothetical protein